MFITVDSYISTFMKAGILMVILAVLIASISIGSCVKTVDKTLKGSLLTESPKILSSSSIQGISKVNYAASNNSWNLSDKDSLQYAGMDWVRTGAERSQTIGDMGGEEMVERPTFGDMGGDEMVERRTFEGWSGNGTMQGDVMQDGAPEVFSQLAPSTIVYFGEASIPLSSYQNTLGKYLWIESYGGLSQYASVPQYSSLYLMAYTSTSGPGEFLEIYPSPSNQGIYQKTDFYFNSGYNRIPYRSDVAGKHYLLFSMGDQSSNAVIIDVISTMGTGSPIVLGTNPSTGMRY
jgi:hypothetical protein